MEYGAGTPYVRPSYVDLAGTPGPAYSADTAAACGPWGSGSLAYPAYDGSDELDRLRRDRLRSFEGQLMAMDGIEEEERLRRWNMRVRWERLEAEDRVRRWDLMHERDRLELGIDGYPGWHEAFGDHWRRFGRGSGAEYDLGGGYVGPSPNDVDPGPSSTYPSRPSRLGVRRRALLASPAFTAGAYGGSSISERLRMALIRDRASLESLHPEERRMALEDGEWLARTSEDPAVRRFGAMLDGSPSFSSSPSSSRRYDGRYRTRSYQ